MNEYNGEDFIIAQMRWSFSRLNSFYNCKYEWHRHYIDCEPSKDSFFGVYGSFCHKILEMYAKRELSLFDLSQYYEEHFAEEVPYDAPPNKHVDIKADYYQKGLDYFDNIDLPIDRYEVVGVEKQIEFELGGYPFVGFIDLLLRDKNDGKLIIVDHKSGSIKLLKSGEVSKSDREHFLEFKRQLYLYSIPIIEEFGEGSVKQLRWNLFKQRDWISIPFDNKGFEEAKDWALTTIKLIENEREWEPKVDYFFCNFLCGINDCPYKGGNSS